MATQHVVRTSAPVEVAFHCASCDFAARVVVEGHGVGAATSFIVLDRRHAREAAATEAAAEAHLTGKRGKQYWRSLDELSDTPEFQKFLDDEFPNRSSLAKMNRRDLLKFMGASLALAGLSGCRSVFMPQDKVVPYVKQPEELVPGKPLFYASAVTLAGYATGVLV